MRCPVFWANPSSYSSETITGAFQRGDAIGFAQLRPSIASIRALSTASAYQCSVGDSGTMGQESNDCLPVVMIVVTFYMWFFLSIAILVLCGL